MTGLEVTTRSVVFHDDGSVEIVYQEKRDVKNGVVTTRMLQFDADIYPSVTFQFQQDCQQYIDAILVCQTEGPPE